MNDLEYAMVSGGIFFVVIVLPFFGYKLYQKFIASYAESNRFGCCNRSHRSATDLLRSLISRRVVPKVILDDALFVVGETVHFRILFPVRSSNYPPANYDSYNSDTASGWNLRDLNIIILKENDPAFPCSDASSGVTVDFSQELLPRDAENGVDTLLIRYSVRESGFYSINVYYKDERLANSGRVCFWHSNLDPEKTTCMRESTIVLSTAAEIYTLFIKPRDRFGNNISYPDVHPDRFNFELMQTEGKEKHSVGSVIFNFSKHLTNDLISSDSFRECVEVKVELELFEPGLFEATITYDGHRIGDGSFDVLILSQDEHRRLRDIMNDIPSNRYLMARVISLGLEHYKKTKEVYIYMTSKVICIKEYFLMGLWPSKLATFRVLPSTKMQLHNINKRIDVCDVSIFDRLNPKVTLEMDISSARIMMAMFSLFLKQRLGGNESFVNKQRFFYEELKSYREGMLRMTTCSLNIQRNILISSSLNETKNYSGKEWCKNFKIRFVGEEGADDGGLRREWLDLVCMNLFENKRDGMFCTMGSSRLVHPNPNRNTSLYTLKHYELAGKIVGKCLFESAHGPYHKQMVNGRFTRSFLAQIIGFPMHYKYFEQDDPELYLSKIKYILENNVEPMELMFTEEEYTNNGQLSKIVELVPNGKKITVTNKNKKEYLTALAHYRLCTKVKKETEAFLKGLLEIVPDGLLTSFDENELEVLMCGQSKFNVKDLQAHHVHSDHDATYKKLLTWFWTILSGFTEEEKGKLLQFTTGSSLLPHNGFRELEPPFRITVTDTEGKLPIAHTCFNEICLSDHATYEQFEKSIRTAITEGSEGFGLL